MHPGPAAPTPRLTNFRSLHTPAYPRGKASRPRRNARSFASPNHFVTPTGSKRESHLLAKKLNIWVYKLIIGYDNIDL